MNLCQLEKSSNLAGASEVGSGCGTLLWIDSLCIPVTPQGARKKAILHMREIYSNAATTIVLDEAIERSRRHSASRDTMATVHTLDWSSRLWTLQEYILSRQVLLLFGSQLIDIRDLIHVALQPAVDDDKKEQCRPSPVGGVVVLLAFSRLHDFNTHDSDQDLVDTLRWTLLENLHSNLAYRTTSYSKYEAICLAALLNRTDVLPCTLSAPAGSEHSESGNICLSRALDFVPRSFLFEDVPRCDVEGLRWAPQSFMWTYKPVTLFEENSSGERDRMICRTTIDALLTKGADLGLEVSDPLNAIIESGTILVSKYSLGVHCAICHKHLFHQALYQKNLIEAIKAEMKERDQEKSSFAFCSLLYSESVEHGCNIANDKFFNLLKSWLCMFCADQTYSKWCYLFDSIGRKSPQDDD
jgi:hypothetical protein